MYQAEEIYQHVLQGFEKTLGPGHESTLQVVADLGVFYAAIGKCDEAESMYQSAIKDSPRCIAGRISLRSTQC